MDEAPGSVGMGAHEGVGDGARAVVHGHGIAVVGQVQGQVLAHHGQADEPHIRVLSWRHRRVTSTGHRVRADSLEPDRGRSRARPALLILRPMRTGAVRPILGGRL